MSDDALRPPVTIQDLLPAMVELASIQHDLLLLIDRPKLPAWLASEPPSGLTTLGAVVEPDIGMLLQRSRELLAWLLAQAKAGS